MKTMKRKTKHIMVIFAVCLPVLLLLQFLWAYGAITATQKQNEGKIILALGAFGAEYGRIDNSLKVIGKNATDKQINTALIDSLLNNYLTHHKLNIKYSYQILPNAPSGDSGEPGEYVGKYIVPIKLSLYGSFDNSNGYQLHFKQEKQKWYEAKEHMLWFFLTITFTFIAITIIGFVSMRRFIRGQQKLADAQADFIYNITHELKTPVATIAMSCKTLKQAGKTAPDVDKISRYIAIIDEENKRVGECVSSLLDTLTVSKQSLNLNKEQVNVNELVKSAADAFKISRNVEVKLNLDEQLPLVTVDKMHIRAVIDNLIDNAIKYSNPNTMYVAIATHTVEEGVEVVVEDKGRGIAAKDQKFVFQKFYRASRSINQDVKGFGLGLYYVSQVVEAHNGTASVTSAVGKGTKVRIFLPFKE